MSPAPMPNMPRTLCVDMRMFLTLPAQSSSCRGAWGGRRAPQWHQHPASSTGWHIIAFNDV